MARICLTLSMLSAGILGIVLARTAVAQDADAGKQLFTQCNVCHSIDGTRLVGPSLQGIDGRAAGVLPGFRYSRAMKAAGITWNEKTLDAYLADPQQAVPGNVMPFSGIADAKQRADVIAYLKTLK